MARAYRSWSRNMLSLRESHSPTACPSTDKTRTGEAYAVCRRFCIQMANDTKVSRADSGVWSMSQASSQEQVLQTTCDLRGVECHPMRSRRGSPWETGDGNSTQFRIFA